jgi:hypothetical protein
LLNAYFYAKRVVKARLLSPQEAKSEALGMRQRPDLPGHFLHLGLSNAHAMQMEQTSQRGINFPIFTLPCGVSLIVPTIQAGELQVRVAVPLIDEKSVAWARECVSAQRIQWLFEVTETRQAVLVQSARSFPSPQSALALITQSRMEVSAAELINDVTSILTALVHDEAMDSCIDGVTVTDVRVGMVDEFSTAGDLASALRHPSSAPTNSALH